MSRVSPSLVASHDELWGRLVACGGLVGRLLAARRTHAARPAKSSEERAYEARAGCEPAPQLVLAALLFFTSMAAAAVPSPESYFGQRMGADHLVLDWDKVVGYFRTIEANSDRIRVEELGKSTDGRPFIAVTIAAPGTLQQLDHYQEIQRRLADPRLTSESEADRFAAEGKAVVLITCSIHATELASTQTAVEFAYRMLTRRHAAHPRYSG